MIKHNTASSVLSPFNPILALNPQMSDKVNKDFIAPILESFFSNKGGTKPYDFLDVDKLLTEVEFNNRKFSFVKDYVYEILVDDLYKRQQGRVVFKPKYTISFDEKLSSFFTDKNRYPYNIIFGEQNNKEPQIKYGAVSLGDKPVLYIIFIDLQKVIRFIKG